MSSAPRTKATSPKGEEKANSSEPSSVGHSILVALLGIWTATVSCLSNAAVSLEGDLDRKHDTS